MTLKSKLMVLLSFFAHFRKQVVANDLFAVSSRVHKSKETTSLLFPLY